jgi:hypothetical protein
MRLKISLVFSLFFSLYFSAAKAQLPDVLNKVINNTINNNSNSGSGKPENIIKNVSNALLGGNLRNDEIIGGLKEALSIGSSSSTKKLGAVDGFFRDAALKILLPKEAQDVEKTLRRFGMGSLVDKAILSMNRAAEDAASGAGDIFLSSIKSMTIADGLNILRGGDFAATDYLKKTTSLQLAEKMRPVIEQSLKKVDATNYWKQLFSTYNRFSSKKVDTDLVNYVSTKTMDGLFYSIGQEEQKIRKDPAAQVTGLLKKVFGGK